MTVIVTVAVAQKVLEGIVERSPGDVEALLNLATALVAQGALDEAECKVDEVLTLKENLPAALYGTIERMTDLNWLNLAMAALATFLLATWFITSSDSGTLVITTMLSMGDDNPPQKFRIIWGLGEGFVAAVLLLAGGLKALQTASIAAALPVSIIMLFMTWGIVKSLKEDPGVGLASAEATAPDGTSLRGDLHS